ncbi:hypothetical protein ABKN59_009198 [Abortiporus biennis]
MMSGVLHSDNAMDDLSLLACPVEAPDVQGCIAFHGPSMIPATFRSVHPSFNLQDDVADHILPRRSLTAPENTSSLQPLIATRVCIWFIEVAAGCDL